MRITPHIRRQQELWETCRLAAAAVVDSLKCPDLLEHAPADNGAGTFLSTNPESKRGLESPRSVLPASSANGALYTSLGQRPRSVGAAPCRTDGTGLQPF
jgi:hypothetical protein